MTVGQSPACVFAVESTAGDVSGEEKREGVPLMGSKKCGRCGTVGHNRRTCGTFPRKADNVPSPRPHPIVPPVKKNQKPVSNLDFLWEQVRPDKVPPHPGTVTDSSANPATAEELETLWILSSSGRTGKREQTVESLSQTRTTWEEEDTATVMSILRVVDDDGAFSVVDAKKFLKNFGAEAKAKIAAHNDTPLVFLIALAKDPAVQARVSVAARRNLPLPILTELGKDKSHTVRNMIAGNATTPVSVLTGMYENVKHLHQRPDTDEIAEMYWLLENPNFPTACVEDVANTAQHYSAWFQALNHPRCPSSVLERAWSRSAHHPNGFNVPIARLSSTVREKMSILRNPNCPEHLIDEGIADPDYRLALWVNENLPEDKADELWTACANTPHMRGSITYEVLLHVASNPNLPQHIYALAYNHPRANAHVQEYLKPRLNI